MTKENTIRRDFHSCRKVYFKDIIPPKNKWRDYKSEFINLSEFKNKLYEDPIYSKELPAINIIYSNFHGNWSVDSYTDDYGMEVLKFTDEESGQYIELAFNNVVDKMKFANEIYSSKDIKQNNPGMDISKLSNQYVLNKSKSIKISNLKKIMLTAITTVMAAFVIKIIKK